jgi:hypothetical protein
MPELRRSAPWAGLLEWTVDCSHNTFRGGVNNTRWQFTMDEINPYEAPYEATASQASEQIDVLRLIRRGQKMFWAIIAISLSPLAFPSATGQTFGSLGLGAFLNFALLFFLWRGQTWAKWMMIVIYAPLSLLYMAMGFLPLNLLCLASGAVMAVIPTLLLTRSMNAWLDYQQFPYDLDE